MKVSVVISLCDNRYNMFTRALDTWTNQTEKDFELILVDDAERNEYLKLCETYDLNFQYIKINNELSTIPIKTFTPVLTNNVGIRAAKGEVICITGPETLQSENNIKIAHTFINRKECGYGLVYKSNKNFVYHIENNWNKSFNGLLEIPGAKADCLTKPPHPPAYYYFMAVKKEYVEKINGLDERFAQGFCGEDDDFANRMKLSGIKPIFEHNIIGIHQDHSSQNTKKHQLRYEQKELRQHNLNLLKENLNKKICVTNLTHIWGDPKVITRHEVFYK